MVIAQHIKPVDDDRMNQGRIFTLDRFARDAFRFLNVILPIGKLSLTVVKAPERIENEPVIQQARDQSFVMIPKLMRNTPPRICGNKNGKEILKNRFGRTAGPMAKIARPGRVEGDPDKNECCVRVSLGHFIQVAKPGDHTVAAQVDICGVLIAGTPQLLAQVIVFLHEPERLALN